MKAKQLPFTTRTGITGYCAPYRSECVQFLKDGRIALEAKRVGGQFASGGLFGPQAEYGTYEFEVHGRLDALDPASVFAIWVYDDATEDEIDAIEYTRWGDANSRQAIHIGEFRKGKRTTLCSDEVRAFDRYLVRLKMTEAGWYSTVMGWMGAGWREIAGCPSHWPTKTLGTLRVALWMPETGPKQNPSVQRVHLVRSTFTPAEVSNG